MPSAPLPPEKQAEVDDLAQAIREAVDVEISELAANLATTDDAHIFGSNEFTIRARAKIAQDRRQYGAGVTPIRPGPGRPGWLPTPASGKEVTSPPPPPLRTARERFPSCSSSLSNALCRTRLSHI